MFRDSLCVFHVFESWWYYGFVTTLKYGKKIQLEKLQSKIVNKKCSIPFNKICLLNIYIYIYIYILSSIADCFIVSQLFSVARHVERLKLGSKTAQLYFRLSIRPLGQQAYNVGKGIIKYYVATAAVAFVCLHFIPYRIPECSIRSKSFCIMRAAAENSFARVRVKP